MPPGRDVPGSADEFEDCFACSKDASVNPLSKSDSACTDDSHGLVEAMETDRPLGAHVRKRKRDNKIVPRSPFWYSTYKKSRRMLKKAGVYYVGFAEDRPGLDVQKNLLDWVEVRQYQCKYFANQLRDYGRISNVVADSCIYEIEVTLQWMLENRESLANRDMGNAWLWVAIEVQQHMSLELRKPFEFDTDEICNRWSLEALNDDMRATPCAAGLFTGDGQRMAVAAEAYSERTRLQHAMAAEHFGWALCSAAPPLLHNPVRKAAAEHARATGTSEAPWLYPRIAAAKKAQRVGKGMFGECVLVDVP